MKILVTTQKFREDGSYTDNFSAFFTGRVVSELESLGEVVYNPYFRDYTRDELKEALHGVDVVFNGWGTARYDKDLLNCADSLKVIAYTGGSVAPIVSEDHELQKRGILLLSGNRLMALNVAEATVCYMLMGQRQLFSICKEMEQDGWRGGFRFTRSLGGETVGIVGFGMIAKFLCGLLKPFNVKIKVWADYDLPQEEAAKYGATVCSLEEVFATSDIVSLHAGMTQNNFHIIDKRLLSMMRDDALLVNTARGALIKEEDLAEEVKTGRIRAVLDVYETEPLPMDSGLRNLPNVLCVPHQSGPTIDVRERISLALIEEVKGFFVGETEFPDEITAEYAARMTDDQKFVNYK